MAQFHINGTFIAPFPGWKEAFEYIDTNIKEKTTIIIDEFPFLAEENSTIKSILQHIINYKWKNNSNILLILCGSSVSFMKTEVMGIKSPLHDRQTSSLEILPFDYLDSSKFFSKYSNEDKLIAYGILGGILLYLDAFDSNETIEFNISKKIIKNGAILHDEPNNLLKAELRETNIYNSILSAIANGKNRIVDMSNYLHEERSKIAKYLVVLQSMRLVEKRVPCGESIESKKTIYVLSDNSLNFILDINLLIMLTI